MDSEPHPTAQKLLEQMDENNIPPLGSLSPNGVRQLVSDRFISDEEPEPVATVRDLLIPGPEPDGEIQIRVYTPEVTDGSLAGLVWFHPGGWVLGDLDTVDHACRALANSFESVVVSVEYRCAPEHRFPAAVQDCYTATRWVVDNAATLDVDPGKIAVGGSSAGGNLAAAVALMARDHDAPDLAYQVLVHPILNYQAEYASSMQSYTENGEGYFLEIGDMEWFIDNYLASEIDGYHPYAFPLRARSLHDVAPATVVTAGFDPLRDEGFQYVERLNTAEVPVEHHHFEGMIHGFFDIGLFGQLLDTEIEQAREAVEAVATDLRRSV